MAYLLDTSIIVELLRKNQAVYDFLAAHKDDVFTTSTLCVFEIASGIYRAPAKDQTKYQNQAKALFGTLSEVLPFTVEQADVAGAIHAELARTGRLIDDVDVLIAATALASRSTLVTFNTKHFARIKGLIIMSPVKMH
ncbi:type II toxin-antitoxin system VapC family toxin [Candidatus Gottesmanbacteria bacterium]|nr:type II toxin-antitoxin system VapC family toxin [Candidatus Gottesmanbacteria bacterium]